MAYIGLLGIFGAVPVGRCDRFDITSPYKPPRSCTYCRQGDSSARSTLSITSAPTTWSVKPQPAEWSRSQARSAAAKNRLQHRRTGTFEVLGGGKQHHVTGHGALAERLQRLVGR